jgi:hypothetical protein
LEASQKISKSTEKAIISTGYGKYYLGSTLIVRPYVHAPVLSRNTWCHNAAQVSPATHLRNTCGEKLLHPTLKFSSSLKLPPADQRQSLFPVNDN